MTTLYWYAGCSTCKKALKFLREAGVEPTLVELKTDPPRAEQRQALAADGMLIKRPILDLGSVVLVGFKAPEWEAAVA
jgi:arsenate reductase